MDTSPLKMFIILLPLILQLYRLRDEVESKKKMKRRQKRIREKAEKDKERKEKEQAVDGTTEALGKHPTVRISTTPSPPLFSLPPPPSSCTSFIYFTSLHLPCR